MKELFMSVLLILMRTTSSSKRMLLSAPVISPLLLPNSTSEVRDLLATERTLLSNLRLATYLAVVSAAIIVSFHLKTQPTEIERRISFPLGLVFGVLSLACLGMGIGNYAQTVEGYARKKALVQSGIKTQAVLGVLGVLVVGTCLFFVALDAHAKG